VLDLIRRNLRFFIPFFVAALILRLIFIFYFPGVVTDSFVYGDIAKNWLQHGIYGLSGPDEVSPTYIRLPGYPAFLAIIFAIFGMEHYRAVLIVQMFVDIGTCLLCCDIALRLFGPKNARVAFALAALCPFLANYSAAALTETLEVFFTALALDLALRAMQQSQLRCWAGCGLACGTAILLRPDGALLLIAIAGFATGKIIFGQRSIQPSCLRLSFAPVVIAAMAIAPLGPWTLRNWQTFHRFQPLAPRYANETGEFVPAGFNRWVKTWIVDYASVEEIYWAVPGNAIEAEKLPARAFDSPTQRSQSENTIATYNAELHVSPELDSKFAALADDRSREHPLRYYVGLPILRIADMWLRPRTEMLPSDSRWWEFNDEPRWSALAVSLGVMNLLYVACACAGAIRFRQVHLILLLLLFIAIRSGFLGSLENPEPRYTLEMYPVVLVLAAALFGGRKELA